MRLNTDGTIPINTLTEPKLVKLTLLAERTVRFINPQHIVSLYPNEGGSTYVNLSTGACFAFDTASVEEALGIKFEGDKA